MLNNHKNKRMKNKHPSNSVTLSLTLYGILTLTKKRKEEEKTHMFVLPKLWSKTWRAKRNEIAKYGGAFISEEIS